MLRSLRLGPVIALAAASLATVPSVSAADTAPAPETGTPSAAEQARTASVSWANVLSSLRQHIARQGKNINPATILPDQTFREISKKLGGNSILMARAVAATLAQHKVSLTDAESSSIQTPRQLTDRIVQELTARAKTAIFEVFRAEAGRRSDKEKAGKLRRDQTFREISKSLGIGSFLVAHIVGDTMTQLGVRLSDQELSSVQTPGALVDLLHAKLIARP
jgi:acyl carrier protein